MENRARRLRRLHSPCERERGKISQNSTLVLCSPILYRGTSIPSYGGSCASAIRQFVLVPSASRAKWIHCCVCRWRFKCRSLGFLKAGRKEGGKNIHSPLSWGPAPHNRVGINCACFRSLPSCTPPSPLPFPDSPPSFYIIPSGRVAESISHSIPPRREKRGKGGQTEVGKAFPARHQDHITDEMLAKALIERVSPAVMRFLIDSPPIPSTYQ